MENSVGKRLVSLDTLRGFTIAGMILVNSPGSWEHIYSPFRHAAWNGLTLADLVFPFFLFIVGASIHLALKKRLDSGASKKSIIGKIVYRSFVIFFIGIALNLLSSDFTHFRIAGVLQRIAICYLLASTLFIYTSRKLQIILMSFILVGYWILMIFIPLPGSGNISFTFDSNWAAWVDSQILPGFMYFKTWDPEGILSTFPALVTTLLGIWSSELIAATSFKTFKMMRLLVYGTLLSIAGLLISLSFPLNKNVWSSSYVLLTAGLASLLWSGMIYLNDIKGMITFSKPGIIFGMNAIFAYVFHALFWQPLSWIKFGGMNLQGFWMEWGSSLMDARLASLIWALLYTTICFLPVYWLYRKKIFLKV